MDKRQNIILLTADSLRADHLGCYGHDSESLTPEIDAFARQGVLFTDTYAQGPYTALSLPSLFTGKLPCRLRPLKWSMRPEHAAGTTVEGNTTFVELLKRAGYHTAAFHSNTIVSRLSGFHKGFDVFYDDVMGASKALPWWLKLNAARAQRLFRTDPFLNAEAINAKVCGWLADAREPFFLWVHYMDTHGPYLLHKVLKGVSRGERLWRKGMIHPGKVTPAEADVLRGNYCKQIRLLDFELGKLWRLFEKERLFERSLVLFTADHGEEFFEHGGYTHTHKLYDELLHVPLVARLPGAVPSIQRGLVGLIQIAPTLLELADIVPPSGFEATSVLPCLLGRAELSNRYVISEAESGNQSICIRTSAWKLIRKSHGAEKELYNLPADPHEQTNLASERTEIVRELEQLLLSHCVDGSALQTAVADEVASGISKEEEAMVAERLRDLGYL